MSSGDGGTEGLRGERHEFCQCIEMCIGAANTARVRDIVHDILGAVCEDATLTTPLSLLLMLRIPLGNKRSENVFLCRPRSPNPLCSITG